MKNLTVTTKAQAEDILAQRPRAMRVRFDYIPYRADACLPGTTVRCADQYVCVWPESAMANNHETQVLMGALESNHS